MLQVLSPEILNLPIFAGDAERAYACVKRELVRFRACGDAKLQDQYQPLLEYFNMNGFRT